METFRHTEKDWLECIYLFNLDITLKKKKIKRPGSKLSHQFYDSFYFPPVHLFLNGAKYPPAAITHLRWSHEK